MKKLLLPLFLLFAVAAHGQDVKYKVTTATASLYKNEGAPYEKIATIVQGESVTLIEKTSESVYKVSYQGKEGYIGKSSISEAGAAEKALADLPIVNGKVEYTNIFEVPGASKDELHSRAKQFIATAFRSANAVIQMDDKEEGIIVGKGISTGLKNPNAILFTSAYDFGYTIKIYVKDGRYKYSLSDIYYHRPASPSLYVSAADIPVEKELFRPDGTARESRQGMKKGLLNSIPQLEAALVNAMQKPVTGESDW